MKRLIVEVILAAASATSTADERWCQESFALLMGDDPESGSSSCRFLRINLFVEQLHAQISASSPRGAGHLAQPGRH